MVIKFKWLMPVFLLSSICIIGCGYKCNTKTEFIYDKPAVIIPEKPKMEDVKWVKIGDMYCVDKENSKKLMKNLYKLDSYIIELQTILKGLER